MRCLHASLVAVTMCIFAIGSATALADGAPSPDCPPVVDAITPQFDAAELERQLTGDGAEGWIHGAIDSQSIYVFTWKTPGFLITRPMFPVVSGSADIMRAMRDLGRHDRVRVRGRLVSNGSPQVHVMATEVTLLERWNDGSTLPPFEHEPGISDALRSQSEILARVHISFNGGRVLILEYRDGVVPVFVSRCEDLAITATLWRNDKVRIKYVVREAPGRPVHLALDAGVARPIEIVERVSVGHGEPIDIEGKLVLFPRNPQTTADVYALLFQSADGLKREYTIVNFESPDVWRALVAKLKAEWDRHPTEVIRDRNKLMIPSVLVRVRGILNIEKPDQGNPQILVDSPDFISFRSAADLGQ